jgi:hypothetical protein
MVKIETTEKKVIIPQADLDLLEECRVEIWKVFQAYAEILPPESVVHLSNVTSKIWKIANRKYPKYFILDKS